MTKQQGSILVLTVLSVAMLMILGVSFLSLSTSEYTMSSMHANSIKAFYAAEAGLTWGRKYLGDNIGFVVPNPDVLGNNAEFVLPFNGSPDDFGSTVVKLQKQGSQWRLVSTSTLMRARQEVTQLAVVTSGSMPDFTLYLPSRPAGAPSGDPQGIVTLANSGTTITGDLPVYGQVDYSSVGGTFPHWLPVSAVVEPEIRPTPADGDMGIYSLPPFTYPELPPRGHLLVHNRIETINTPGQYDSVTVTGWPSTLTIDASNPSFTTLGLGNFTVNNAEGTVTIVTGTHDFELYINSCTFGGESIINIVGPGKVRIYVRDYISLDGTFYINYSRFKDKNKWVYTAGDSTQLTLYYYGSSQLTIGGSTHLCGSLVSGPAPLHLKSADAVIGHVVSGTTNTIVIGPDGGSERHVTGIVYSPYAHVHLSSGRVTGAIVARSAALTGTSNLHLDSSLLVNFSSFFLDIGGTAGGGGSGGFGGTNISFGAWQGR